MFLFGYILTCLTCILVKYSEAGYSKNKADLSGICIMNYGKHQVVSAIPRLQLWFERKKIITTTNLYLAYHYS